MKNPSKLLGLALGAMMLSGSDMSHASPGGNGGGHWAASPKSKKCKQNRNKAKAARKSRKQNRK